MRALLQRVIRGSVTVEGQEVARIDKGLVILVGIAPGDTPEQAAWLAEKAATLRIFEDAEGKMNLSAVDVGGQAIVVSQFTLYADTRRGRRPSFTEAALPQEAEPLVAHFARCLEEAGLPTQTGVFGAHMLVEIHNDGPVTILLER
jgi:D-tyrosyl-tRNA(Tyr) deacylase